MSKTRGLTAGFIGLAAALQLAGCPVTQPFEFVAGGTGDLTQLGAEASVDVLSPVTDLAITGGAPVEVNWIAIATTNFAIIDVIFDLDQDPDNDNEVFAQRNIQLGETTTLLDTTALEANTYYVGVVLRERNEIAAFGYAPGRLIINQRTQFFFSSPRDNFAFDRTQRLAPRFDVAWTLLDPDSTVRVEIFLDPDDAPNGNEFKLRESDSQTGDSFSFNFPTALFEPGVYRILAIVSDGVGTAEFYAPGSIRLRSRLAGVIDLRDLHLPSSSVRGAIFGGFNPRDNLGSFVSTCRDLDSDGFADFIMLAQFGKPGYFVNAQRGGIGEAYLVYGRRERFSGQINVNSAAALFRAVIYEGVREAADPIRPSRGITSFTVLSDWDSDGVREFAFGLPFTDSLPVAVLDVAGYFRTGAVVVTAGSTLLPQLGFPGSNAAWIHDLDEIGTLPHEPLEELDPVVCQEGFIGPKAPVGAGGGGSTLFHRHLYDAADDPLGGFTLGCRISSNEPFDQFGETISAYEFDSIIMSAPNADPAIGTFMGPSLPGAGIIFIYYNDAPAGFYPWSNVNSPQANDIYAGTTQTIDVDLIPHGGPYHYIVADARGFEVGGMGGFILIDNPGYTVDRDHSEPCEFVWAGRAPQPTTTLRIWGQFEGGRLSNAKGIGDFNADGIRDLVVGNPLANEGAGAVFVVIGRLRNLVWGDELPVEELGLPMSGPDDPQGVRVFDGIQIVGEPGTRLGESQDRAGDFNGDGLGDIVVGSPLLNNRQGGAAVFFGSRDVINLTQEEIPMLEIPQRGLGVVFVGEGEGDLAGARVAAAGDVDGDGLEDILIAAPDCSVRLDIDLDGTLEIDRTDCGVVYLVYGSSELRGTLELADIGTERLPGAVFVGRYSGDFLGAGLGEQGDRSFGISLAGDVDGDGRQDLLMSSVKASPRDRVRAGEAYLIYGQGD